MPICNTGAVQLAAARSRHQATFESSGDGVPERPEPPRPLTMQDYHWLRDLVLASPDEPARPWACALTRIITGSDPMDALALKSTPGQRSAASRARTAERNRLIREMAKKMFSGRSTSEQARLIAAEDAAYQRSRAARQDLDLERMPESYERRPIRYLFEIARLPELMPSERTIRLILSTRPLGSQ